MSAPDGNDLASQLSRALNAKNELEIRVARLEGELQLVRSIPTVHVCADTIKVEAENARLTVAVESVAALHSSLDGYPRCEECGESNPCKTIQIILASGALSAVRPSDEKRRSETHEWQQNPANAALEAMLENGAVVYEPASSDPDLEAERGEDARIARIIRMSARGPVDSVSARWVLKLVSDDDAYAAYFSWVDAEKPR